MYESPPPRLTVEEFFDLLTLFYACRGTCDRFRAAATLRDVGNVLLSGGYNGSISGEPHCDDPEVGHLMEDGHCIRTNHAEDNAILNCLDLTRIRGGVATVLGNPCYPCARKVISKGVTHIRYLGDPRKFLGSDYVAELCQRRGVTTETVSTEQLLVTLQKALAFLQGPGGLFKDMPGLQITQIDVGPVS